MNTTFFDSFTSGKSLVVGGAFFESDARWVELAILGVFVLVVAWVAASLFALALEYLIANARRFRMLKDAIDRRTPLVSRFKRRFEKLVEKVNVLNDQVEEVQAARVSQLRKLKKLNSACDQLVRQIGENIDGTSCFNFSVSNRYVLAYATKGQSHPLLDESWKSGQLVEVWAPTAAEASLAVMERYPCNVGFVIGKVGEDEEAAGPKRKAAVARAR